MTTLVKTGDPRSLLQHPTAGLGFSVDQLCNLPLPYQRGRMRTSGGIGEQHLNIPRPRFLAVGFISRSRVACDPPNNLQLVLIVERSRCQAFGVIKCQRHFGKISRGTRGCSCENHIFHPAATHGFGTVLAHDPAQGFQQVRLATTVRSDDTRQTR